MGALSVGGFEAYQAGYVAAQKWHGIYWVYIVSCFFQLLMNNEISRYTMATGETVLQGFTRLKPAKVWGWGTTIFCILQQGWPAWIGGAAAGVAALLGIATWQIVAMVALGLVLAVFSASKRVYSTLEYTHVRLLRGGQRGPGAPHRFNDQLGGRQRGELGLGSLRDHPGRDHPHDGRPLPERSRQAGSGTSGTPTGCAKRAWGWPSISATSPARVPPEEITATGFMFDTNNPEELSQVPHLAEDEQGHPGGLLCHPRRDLVHLLRLPGRVFGGGHLQDGGPGRERSPPSWRRFSSRPMASSGISSSARPGLCPFRQPVLGL